MEDAKKGQDSNRRRFIRTLTTLGAAGGVATLLNSRVTERPLIQLAQAASGDYLSMDNVNTAAGTTELDSTLATSTSGAAFKVVATATAAGVGESPTGVYGRTDAGGGPWPDGPLPNGVWGYASGASGATTGVYGVAESPDGAGMWGENNADSGRSVGVGGVSHSQEGIGVYGLTYAPSSENMQPVSVYGQADAAGGDPNIGNGPWPTGVMGYASAASGETRGVQGIVESTAGYGVQGTANASEGWAVGVWGGTNSVDGVGIRGRSNPSGGTWQDGPWPIAISGYAAGASGATRGVVGETDSPIGIGVNGYAGAPGQGEGEGACGVEGDTASEWGGAGVVGWAFATSGYNAGVWGGSRAPDGVGVQGDADGINGIGVLAHARNLSVVPIVALAASGQANVLQQWVRNDWTPLAVVDKDGQFGIGTATPARQLHIVGSNAVARLDRNVDSASFIFVRTNTDYSQVLKTFTFGVKATGVDSGSFFIGDMHTNVSGSSDNRLLIDSTGNVGIGTTTPSSKLHVAGRVKALGYDTGDITFANSYSVTEDETAGLAFKNDAGEKIAVLDREGNWHIKGKVIEDL